MNALGSRKGVWRFVSAVCKGGHVAAPGCEWDKQGGFTKSGPGDSQNRVPRSFFLSVSYGPEPRVGGAAPGDRRWTGATPPFLPPGAAKRCRLMCTARAIAWGGRSRPNYPWREGQEEERGPGGPVPPDPPVAPEPLAAHIATSEPDARRGGASPPEPPGCEEIHTNQRSFQRGTVLRLDDLTPPMENQRFPTGCFVLLPVQSCHRSPKPPAAPVPFALAPGSPEPWVACDDGQNRTPDLRRPVSAPYRPTGGRWFFRRSGKLRHCRR